MEPDSLSLATFERDRSRTPGKSFFAPHYGASEDQQVSPWVVNLHFIGDSTGFTSGARWQPRYRCYDLERQEVTNDVGDKFVLVDANACDNHKEGEVSLSCISLEKGHQPAGHLNVREIKKRL